MKQVPRTFIRNIAIKLRRDYQFDNAPYEGGGRDSKLETEPGFFIGREGHKAKFKSFLNSKIRKGAFLVTGYRGMGKTSFVNHVLNNYINENRDREIISVRITIAQNNPSEHQILRQIAISTFDQYKSNLAKKEASESIFGKNPKHSFDVKVSKWFKLIKLLFIACLIILVPAVIFLIFPNELRQLVGDKFCFFCPDQKSGGYGNKGNIFSVVIRILIALLVFLPLLHFVLRYITELKGINRSNEPGFVRLKWLVERSFSEVREEKDGAKLLDLEIKGIKVMNEDSNPKRIKEYPLSHPKEIEYELKQFLGQASSERLEFVYVFDELDKVDAYIGSSNIYMDLDGFEKQPKDQHLGNLLRERKRAVMNVIAGLKNFFTTANARFIFIAGREMFDASLADISDKQSPLSSIFTYTFNIESLLKEERGNIFSTQYNSSLTVAIEEFVKFQLFTDDERVKFLAAIAQNNGDPGDYLNGSLFNYLCYHYKEDKTGDEFAKLYFMFQAFVTYLAYRSNGSPKKMIRVFHEFVKVRENRKAADGEHGKTGDSRDIRELYFKKSEKFSKEEDSLNEAVLYFNYYDQSRIGFINYLYRPFLIQHGRGFKLYSENAITAVPYLFDHLMKFHPFAFSRSSLELVPELLSPNKTPAIKLDLDQIISFLESTHIRETEVELWDYKFYSKTFNEIAFLSRVFEEEAAAFNFTLDESFGVKLLLNEKIKELRSIFSKYYQDAGALGQQMFSIALHNGNLGDINFFDQEYDEAIGNYSDAIRPINNLKVEVMNVRDFVTLIRNKLKIGLSFEKISSYEEALSFYTDSANDVKRFLTFHLKYSDSVDFNKRNRYLDLKDLPEIPEIYHSSSINDLLQIAIQCFLAKLFIQEKLGLEGVTTQKINLAMGEFFKIADKTEKVCGRSNLIIANGFLHLGRLAFFRNSPVDTDSLTTIKYDIPVWLASRKNQISTGIVNLARDKDKRQPLLAYQYYLLGLDEVVRSRKTSAGYSFNDNELMVKYEDKGDGVRPVNHLPEYFTILTIYDRKKRENYFGTHYKYIALFLSAIGDCLLSLRELSPGQGNDESAGTGNYSYIKVHEIFDVNSDKSDYKAKFQAGGDGVSFLDLLKKSSTENFTISDVLRCYYLSAKYFQRCGSAASAGFQYRKILHVLRLVIKEENSVGDYKLNEPFLRYLENKIVKRAKNIVSGSSARTGRHMIIKSEADGVDASFINQNIAIHPETREIDILFSYIKVKLGAELSDDFVNKLINPNYSVATQNVRFLELDLYSKILLKEVGEPVHAIKKYKSCSDEKKEEFLDRVTSYLFSRGTILRILKIYGPDYMLGYSFLAYTHKSLADFLLIYQKLDLIDRQRIESDLELLFNDKSRVQLDREFHYGMAKDYYVKAIELHTATGQYKKTIRDLIYLEDDFNDSAYHFGASLDRYLIGKEVFENKIKECVKNLNVFARQARWIV